jgi:hypothetical protein
VRAGGQGGRVAGGESIDVPGIDRSVRLFGDGAEAAEIGVEVPREVLLREARDVPRIDRPVRLFGGGSEAAHVGPQASDVEDRVAAGRAVAARQVGT